MNTRIVDLRSVIAFSYQRSDDKRYKECLLPLDLKMAS